MNNTAVSPTLELFPPGADLFPEPSSEACNSEMRLGMGHLGKPKWTGLRGGEWEILIYEHNRYWEACFFKWEYHHEHVTGTSLIEVLAKAETRIREMGAVEGLSNVQSLTYKVDEIVVMQSAPAVAKVIAAVMA